ncbi:dynein axonemal intermediate chain 3-like [Aphidius gifuensis]|uniref:dynein axonemal intermediate chain 3-like n=1 Tax=Aphidius gifuensis TaxID=684658 RepID=UPI001CDCC8D0|nr:dynein axonemal intermediate chain 3-like [Aphidius gifuensis]
MDNKFNQYNEFQNKDGQINDDILSISTNENEDYSGTSLHYETTKINGMVRIPLSSLTQKIIGCEVGENVTTEYPWILIRKQIIEDNIYLHPESSDFLPIKNEIYNYPGHDVLIGYAPTSFNQQKFYICLTENSRDEVTREINKLRNDQENRVKKAVFKTSGSWNDFGSSSEIISPQDINKRPLIDIQITASCNKKINLIDRNADEQRDSYIEIVNTRYTFNNIIRKQISRGDQITPIVHDDKAQTTTSSPLNSWSQYLYSYKTIDNISSKEIKDFFQLHIDNIYDQILQNSKWDLHINEYDRLVKDPKDSQAPIPITYKPYQNYHYAKLTKNKIINDLSWHPLLTGIAIAAYCQNSKSEIFTKLYSPNEIQIASQDENYVLVWSFSDCLAPKLILECPREVTTVSVRPLDGNIIIGGCINGQIAIWSIPREIDKIENVEILTTTQMENKNRLNNLMNWVKNINGTGKIYPTIMSSLRNSQKGEITEIIWLSSHSKISENGRIVEVDNNVDSEELGWQFVTSSEDGSLAFWDLSMKKETELEKLMRKKNEKKKKIIRKPESLKQLISQFKILNNVFSPTYILTLKYPDKEIRVVITTMSFYVPEIKKIQVEPFPINENDVSRRRHYKAIVNKPNYETPRIILVGTLTGDIGQITWEGFEFATGLTMNREATRWIWKNSSVHNGPVTHMVRSKYLNNVVLTVGGGAFAVWREDFDEPVFMKTSSTFNYSACSWGTFRPTVMILGRDDGTVEIWDLIVKSHEPCFTQSVSGGIITGIYTHNLYLNPQCIALCDFNGAMRIFLAPSNLLIFEESHVNWFRQYIDSEVERIIQFNRWQNFWTESNVKSIEQNRIREVKKPEQKRIDAVEKTQTEMAELTEKIGLKSLEKRKPGEFLEQAKAQWKKIELQRMQRVILEKKGLRPEDLERRREPVLKLRKENKIKQLKIRTAMLQQDKIFSDGIAKFIPEKIRQSNVKYKTDNAIIEDIENKERPNLKQEILREYEEVSKSAMEKLKNFEFKDPFDWQKMITEGKERRQSIDVELNQVLAKRLNSLD